MASCTLNLFRRLLKHPLKSPGQPNPRCFTVTGKVPLQEQTIEKPYSPATPRKFWSEDETRLLKQACVDALENSVKNGRSPIWSHIAKSVPGRSHAECRNRAYNLGLSWSNRFQPVDGRDISCRKSNRWTAEEDRKLVDVVENLLESTGTVEWKKVAKFFPHRKPEGCGIRFRRVDGRDVPCRKSTRWTAEEDRKLVDIVEHHFESARPIEWKEVAKLLSLRPTSCKYRYYHLRTKTRADLLCSMEAGLAFDLPV